MDGHKAVGSPRTADIEAGEQVTLALDLQPRRTNPEWTWPGRGRRPPLSVHATRYAVRLRVNGAVWSTAGVGPGDGPLQAGLVWTPFDGGRAHPEVRLSLMGGSPPHVQVWTDARMHLDDKIEMSLVCAEEVDAPIVQYHLRDGPPGDVPGLDPRE